METITGFDQQMGAASFAKKSIAPKKIATKTATKTAPPKPSKTIRSSFQPEQVKASVKKVLTAQVPFKSGINKNISKKSVLPMPENISMKNVLPQIVNTPVANLPSTSFTNVTSPAIIEQANPIQRSFAPVDLPFKTVQNQNTPTKQKIENTPYNLSVDIDMVVPEVDNGISNYYGK